MYIADMSSMTAPTRSDAERAAQALVRMDAAQVLLFGSVADGTATPSSDIDLVAVFDDLGDYSGRDRIKYRAQEVAHRASGRFTDVFVTDRPEWRKRTRMRTSFEAGIHRRAVALVDRPPNQEIDWDKDTPMPTTDADEAHQDLGAVEDALLKAFNKLHPSYDELDSLLYGQADRWDGCRFRRMIELCEDAHAAVETALKAFTRGVLGQYPERGDPRPPHRTPDRMSAPGGPAALLRSAISPLDPKDISPWRSRGHLHGRQEFGGQPIEGHARVRLPHGRGRPALLADRRRGGGRECRGSPTCRSRSSSTPPTPAVSGSSRDLRRDPDFAVGTYARRSLTPPPSARFEPAPPPTDARGQATARVPGPGRQSPTVDDED